LTDLGLTLSGFKIIGQKINELSDTLTQGRYVDLILSGYNLKVLPFAWSNLISGLLGLKLDFADYFKEENLPPIDKGLVETKEMVKTLKRYLSPYWKCMSK